MQFFNNFNEMFKANNNTNKNMSVFNQCKWEYKDEHETEYVFEGYDDGTAYISVEYITDYSPATYWDPEEYSTNFEEYNIDFKTDEGYEWLKKYGYLLPEDELDHSSHFATGNTTNEPITKESWGTYSRTLFDWEWVWNDLWDDMSGGLILEIIKDFKHTKPDFPLSEQEIEDLRAEKWLDDERDGTNDRLEESWLDWLDSQPE